MFKQIRILFIAGFFLMLTSIVSAQDASVDYRYDGMSLQRLENGVVVQAWTLPNSLETQQVLAALQAKAQSNDPDVRYVFDNDRMYHLRHNQVIALWLLRGGVWVDEPQMIVQYVYNGQALQRFVNGKVQQAWTLPTGLETYELMTAMQAEADQLAIDGVVVEAQTAN